MEDKEMKEVESLCLCIKSVPMRPFFKVGEKYEYHSTTSDTVKIITVGLKEGGEDKKGAYYPFTEVEFAEYFRTNFYITTSTYFTAPPLLCALQVFGADRMLFAVDYPFSSNAEGRKMLDIAAISPNDLAKIAHKNSERLLKL